MVRVVVGLDAGTTSVTALAAGADGVVRGTASRGVRLRVQAPGRAELDPAELVAAALGALSDVAAQARAQADEVVAVALAAALHGVVPLDAAGRPLGRLLTWADERGTGPAGELHRSGRAAALHARTGTPVHAMSPLCTLAALRADDAGSFRAVPRWGGVKELLVGALGGDAHVVDLSCASATGLWSHGRRDWDEEALELAGVGRAQLAEVRSPTDTACALPAHAARATGLPPELPIVLGAGDGPLATLGVGALGDGVAALSLGTSGALRTVVPAPEVDDAGRLFCYALTEEHWVVGGAVSNGASAVRWASLALAAAPEGADLDAVDAELLAEAAAVPPGSEGLLCLPYPLGERAPDWQQGRRGAYVGLRRDHRRAHLVRAAVEGVCQQLALVADALVAAGHALHEVRATGGALAAPLWVEVLAAALDRPLRTAQAGGGTALGAALLGSHAVGGLPDLESAARVVRPGPPVLADPAVAALYAGRRPLVSAAVTALADVVAALEPG